VLANRRQVAKKKKRRENGAILDFLAPSEKRMNFSTSTILRLISIPLFLLAWILYICAFALPWVSYETSGFYLTYSKSGSNIYSHSKIESKPSWVPIGAASLALFVIAFVVTLVSFVAACFVSAADLGKPVLSKVLPKNTAETVTLVTSWLGWCFGILGVGLGVAFLTTSPYGSTLTSNAIQYKTPGRDCASAAEFFGFVAALLQTIAMNRCCCKMTPPPTMAPTSIVISAPHHAAASQPQQPAAANLYTMNTGIVLPPGWGRFGPDAQGDYCKLI